MVKALLNRYQNEIVCFIWIVGSILMAYFILDQDKYYITSHYESYYQGDPIHYFNYTVNGKDKSFGSANVDIYNGYSQDRLTRRARCDRWDKFIEQGYFKALKKFAINFGCSNEYNGEGIGNAFTWRTSFEGIYYWRDLNTKFILKKLKIIEKSKLEY